MNETNKGTPRVCPATGHKLTASDRPIAFTIGEAGLRQRGQLRHDDRHSFLEWMPCIEIKPSTIFEKYAKPFDSLGQYQ